jgi:hypothetical protein
MFFLIVISRWAIVRAFLAVSATSTGDRLKPILHAAAVKIYRSTLRFGPLDPEAEQRSIAGLDARLGYSTTETTKLIENCRKFAAVVAGL